jgi:hypothetical protein
MENKTCLKPPTNKPLLGMAGRALGIGFIVKSHDEKIPFFTHYLIILVGFIPYTSHIYDVIEYYIING